jgi:hypothetical protein
MMSRFPLFHNNPTHVFEKRLFGVTAMDTEPPFKDIPRLLADLRDSLVQLSSSLKDMQYERSVAHQDAILEEVASAVEKIRQDTHRL